MKNKTAIKSKLLLAICYSLFAIHCLFAETLVDVIVPANITLGQLAKKYLKKEELADKLYEYNAWLPKDKSQPIKKTEIKIPKLFLKAKVGDVTFLKHLAKTKKRNETFWKDLKKNQRLFPGDGVMTWGGGIVKISFLAGGSLTVATDSLIFLKDVEERPVTKFLAGNLSVDDVKVVSHGVKIKPKKGSQYNVNTSAEKDVRLSVQKGSVDVTAKNKTVTVKEGFKTEVKFGKTPELPSPLPPGITDFHHLRDLKEGEKYHLQIALDKNFEKIVVDKYLENKDEVEEARTNLPTGGYYLRISLLTVDGFESKWSDFYYFVKGPESNEKLEITSITQISPTELEVKGVYPGITAVAINGFAGTVGKNGQFVCRFKIGDNKMFSIFIQSNSGPFVKRYKKGSSNLWLPIDR